MTFYYSMKQILRSPLKSILFLLLAGTSAFLLSLGGSLWEINQAMLKEFEDIFMTVGTVEQKKDHIETATRWDAVHGYEYSTFGVYGKWISREVLDFEGAGYLLKAKQRPYFGALTDKKVRGTGYLDLMVVEATPVESGRADESFPMRVEKVLSGELTEGEIIYICDHFLEEARSFEQGKTYIMLIDSYSFVHGSKVEHIAPEDYVSEYCPSNSVASRQYTMDGDPVYDAVAEAEDDNTFDVVTEGFYETERGKRWLEMAKLQDYQFRTIPVQPVDGTSLLMPFYWKDARISEGRDITEEEYGQGSPVCLISEEIALLFGKGVGDTLNLPLYYASYVPISGHDGGMQLSILNAKGETYPVFHEQEYEIVGIYTTSPVSKNEYGLSRHEVIIPMNAVPENAWADNIVWGYPIVGPTTSFQIPNGTIEDFMAAWEKQGVDGLEFKFYDRGYTHLQAGIEGRKLMAVIFLVSGSVMAVMILCFFSNLFITGQRQRIVTERLLGRTKKQCAVSVLTGFFVLAVLGTAVGSAAGWMSTGVALQAAEKTTEFDTTFSNTVIEQTKAEEIDGAAAEEQAEERTDEGAASEEQAEDGTASEKQAEDGAASEKQADAGTAPGQRADAGIAAVSGLGMLLAAAVIAGWVMRQTLKKETLQMLGELEE